MRRFSWLLPIAFLAVVVIVTAGALLVIATLTQKHIGAIDLNSQDLKVRLDELRITLQLLIVAAGLFAIAQGASAFFNAQSFTKQAEDAIKRIQDQAREAEARYPMFARTEAVRREAYAHLADIFRDPFFLDWRTPVYQRLPLANRQLLLSVERFIGIELLPHPGGPVEYVRDLRRLANFYASKHRYDSAHGGAHWTDLERSEYYLTIATHEAGSDSFHLLTDLGVLYMEFHSPRRLDDAERLFKASLERKPNQQRALYNLALVARYREDWPEAIRQYDQALRHDDWERQPMDEMRCAILYNCACAYGRFAQAEPTRAEELTRKCLERLHSAAEYGLVAESVIEKDVSEATGAFAGLDDATKMAIRNLKPSLTTPRHAAGTMTMVQRVQRAAEVLRTGR